MLLFRVVQNRFLLPVLPYRRDGRHRRGNGKTVISIERAAEQFNLPQHALICVYEDYLKDLPIDPRRLPRGGEYPPLRLAE
jgi:hypothetical protein